MAKYDIDLMVRLKVWRNDKDLYYITRRGKKKFRGIRHYEFIGKIILIPPSFWLGEEHFGVEVNFRDYYVKLGDGASTSTIFSIKEDEFSPLNAIQCLECNKWMSKTRDDYLCSECAEWL